MKVSNDRKRFGGEGGEFFILARTRRLVMNDLYRRIRKMRSRSTGIRVKELKGCSKVWLLNLSICRI